MRNVLSLMLGAFLLVAACSDPPSGAQTESQAQAPFVAMSAFSRTEMATVNTASFETAGPPTRAPADAAPIAPPTNAPPANAPPTQGAPTDVAAVEATPDAAVRYNGALVRIQVLLDRAHFSPGVIDGFDGDNVAKAISAYQTAMGGPVNGLADDALLQTLSAADAGAALTAYVITAQDVVGPFAPVPDDLEAMSAMAEVGFESSAEAIAEKFHMDIDLLRTLNPSADFSVPGTEIVVANTGGGLATMVASIEIDKPGRAVRAYDAEGALLAFYPATIGSEAAPAPTGEYAVRAIAFDPTYHYDATRLPTFGQREHGPLTIQAGPNNPVGSVWIALTLDTYGIHGAPEASLVSKTQSHGCIRLTNWDAVELARAVRAGVPVRFLESSADARSAQDG